jgi:transcriptional regulator with XRE-family HTH domain
LLFAERLKEVNAMTFGERLKALREEKGYKQYELAAKIGISKDVVCRYEKDQVQPTLSRIEWLCTALEVTATELLGF